MDLADYLNNNDSQFQLQHYTAILKKVTSAHSTCCVQRKPWHDRKTLHHQYSVGRQSYSSSMQSSSKDDIEIQCSLQQSSALVQKESLDNILHDGRTSSDVIDGYMVLIANAAYQKEEKSVLVIQTHIFQTMQSPELMRSNFKKVAKKRDDSDDPEDQFDYAVTAWCQAGIHWVGMVYDFKTCSVTYIDPLCGKVDETGLELFVQYINMYSALKYNCKNEVKAYKVMSDDEHFPKQNCATSCGIYVCMLL